MAQLNFYVNDKIEKDLRQAAKKSGKTISAFVAEIVQSHFGVQTSDQNYFSKFYASIDEDFFEHERQAAQDRDEL